jgi:CrcB protein
VAYVYIIMGAVAGAPLRYFIQGRMSEATSSPFPWGTLAVNVSGCLAIGLLLTIAEQRDFLSREARLLVVVGFLGSYTTFSAFGWETYALLRDDDVVRAAANVLASVAAGLFGVWLGTTIGKAV